MATKSLDARSITASGVLSRRTHRGSIHLQIPPSYPTELTDDLEKCPNPNEGIREKIDVGNVGYLNPHNHAPTLRSTSSIIGFLLPRHFVPLPFPVSHVIQGFGDFRSFVPGHVNLSVVASVFSAEKLLVNSRRSNMFVVWIGRRRSVVVALTKVFIYRFRHGSLVHELGPLDLAS